MADKQRNSSDNDSSCVLCCKDIEIYAIGSCNHPICYECSTRLRVLCKDNGCPLCRQKMKKVYFTSLIKPYEELYKHYKPENSGDFTHGIYYFSPEIKERQELLFARVCNICEDVSLKFKTNEKLELHLLREHGLSYCPICVKRLKLFRFERRRYTESELERHNRQGDSDDASYKGHSLCEFCSKYFYDKDELYFHSRRDHFCCHLCSEDSNKRSFFITGADLYTHFRNDHYLCQKGNCVNEQLLSVFKTKEEYNNHLTVAHRKQERRVDEDFNSRQPYQSGFIREYDNSNIHSTTLSQASASSNLPEAPNQRIVRNNNLSWVTKTKQASASKAYPTLKLSQNTRDNFFKQFESNSASQPSTSFGRIKKSQMEATTQSSSRNKEIFSFGVINIAKQKKDSNETAKGKNKKKK